MENNNFIYDKFLIFKNDFFNSKRYWIIYLILILMYSLFNWNLMGYFNLNQILGIILLSLLGVFCISYFYGHNDSELYKSVFVVIILFGVVFSFLSPVMFVADEVEHFVRAEMTSRGVFIPEYFETPYVYEGIQEKGYYLTIQSTFDLIDNVKFTESSGYDRTNFSNVFVTDVVDMPINSTLVKYHSAFAQNPFYGYIAPALGIFLAKLLGLNAIWMMWLGRLCNLVLYAFMVSWAIKKTPILKVPMFIIACIPLALVQAASLSIDVLINGLTLISISYFFKMLCSDNLDYDCIVKFSVIVLLLGLCKVTYFSFIFLLIFIPKNNFKEKKYYYLGFLSIFLLSIIAALWSKYYANPNYINSYRFVCYKIDNVNPSEQLNFILSHKFDTFVCLVKTFFESILDLIFVYGELNKLFFLFLIVLSLFYPQPKFNLKLRFETLFVFLILYFGTLFVLLLNSSTVNTFLLWGFHSRYIFPAITLLPFVFGINHFKFNTFKLDLYLIVIMLGFLSFNLIYYFISYC